MRKVDLKAVKPADITDAPKLVVPMPEPIEVPESLLKSLGEPEKMWIYRTDDGSAYGAVARWDPEGTRKQVRPIVWDGKKFVTSGFGPGRPLYNSDLLAARPMAPVLVVEGEKAVDGAAQYAPDGWVVTTWQGGSNAWEHTDWSLLAGHRVVLWPDNDGPGVNAMVEIQSVLSAMQVPASLVQISAAFPDGWDLADPLPEQYNAKQITALLKKELKSAVVLETHVEELVEPASAPVENDPDEESERQYRPLGYDHGTYYIMCGSEYQILEFGSENLMREGKLRSLQPDLDFWEERQSTRGKRIDWISAGLSVINECRQMGVYDPAKLRGRGVWMDKDENGKNRAVIHTGQKLYVSKEEEPLKQTSFVRIKSPWIYESRREIITQAEYNTPATDDEGRMIREMCRQPRWSKDIYGDLLAGWIATAPICGGLDWRTHCWLTGNAGSGKSTVANMVVGKCLGRIAIWPVGSTTEAGIRSALKSDALAVVFDESEDDKYAEQRRDAVLGLMRQASTEGRGTIIKGSSTHSAHEFSVRSQFMLVSIGTGLKKAADLTRTAVLTLRPINSYEPRERIVMEERWNRFQDLNAMLPDDMPQKLLVRQAQNLFMLRDNIKTFKETISNIMGSPRIGDQLGTLLAGAHSLWSSQRLNAQQCEKYLGTLNLEDFLTTGDEREDVSLLHHLCGAMIRVETTHGTQDRTIGELIAQALRGEDGLDVPYSVCKATLSRYGMKVEIVNGKRTGIWIANKCPALERVMQTADYSEGWLSILQRHPYAVKSASTLRFGGVTSKATFMPTPEWPVFDED